MTQKKPNMKIRLFSILLLLTVAGVLFFSCKRDRFSINLTGESVDLEIMRLEEDLFNTDPGMISEQIPVLKEKYGTFLQLLSNVINAGDVNDPEFGDYLTIFVTDRLNNEVYSGVMKLYLDVSSIETDLEEAFSHYNHYFPDSVVPSVYTCITGFNSSIITGDSVLGISLDRYLGAESSYYPRLMIYSYLSARMTPEYIVPDAVYGWGASEWYYPGMGYTSETVLSALIHEGKLKYYVRSMLPELPDEIIFGFTSDQMKFCRNNEGQMWQYLVENDLLFKTDQFTVRKLTGEAPFTSFFTNESPGRAAVWLGYRIAESFMERNQDTSLEELLNMTDVQLIVEKAKYNPR